MCYYQVYCNMDFKPRHPDFLFSSQEHLPVHLPEFAHITVCCQIQVLAHAN